MRNTTQVKLRDIASRVTTRNTSENTNVLTISATHGLVSQEEYFTRRVASSDLTHYYLMKEGDFAYNKSYSTGWPVGVVRRLERYEEGIVSPLYICFHPIPDRVDSSFLQYYFDSGMLDEEILLIAKEGVRNHGLLNIGVEDFFDLPLTLPLLAEQQRIAEILDEVDAQIKRTNTEATKLSRVLRGTLLRTMDAVQSAPYTVWLPVKEAGEVRLGRQRSPEHSEGEFMRPYLRVANVFDGFIDYSDVLSMNFNPIEQERYEIQPGDILLNEGQSIELVGRSALYDGPPGMFFQNTLIRFRPKEILPEFARIVFKYWFDTGVFSDIAKKTTSIAHLGGDRFGEIPFPIPDKDAQNRAIAAVKEVDNAIRVVGREVVKLKTLKKALMDDLLTGKVRIPSPV
ncbi:restriction endonuclease subunit S [Streptomyces sp. NPDC087850]|uniref:restriction endonuclease subunit S n=1 Tax=unclassified Streptomyces TaxID=2593676 RepID=UPI0037FF760C